MTSRAPWWAWVALLALAARLVFLFGAAEPILYSHPYNYFHGAQEIVEHPDPWTVRAHPRRMAPLARALDDRAPLLRLPGRAHGGVRPAPPAHTARAGRASTWPVRRAHRAPRARRRRPARRRGPAWPTPSTSTPSSRRRSRSPRTSTPSSCSRAWCSWSGRRRARGDRPPSRGARRLGPARGRRLLIGLSALARAVSTAFVPLAAAWRWGLGRDRDALLRAVVDRRRRGGGVVPWTSATPS